MKQYGIFKSYIPVDDYNKQLLERGVQFISDESGNDWYALVKEHQNSSEYNYVLCMDHDNVVIAVFPVSGMQNIFPHELKVALLESVPDYLESELGQWILMKSGKYKSNVAYHDANVSLKKDEEIENATAMITHLQDIIDVEDTKDLKATQKELLEWKRYRVALVKLADDAKITDFPTKPV